MSHTPDAIRDHLVRVLSWDEAHVGFGRAIDNIPPQLRGARARGFDHSPWQLLEHLRLAQEDLIDFCRNPKYIHSLTWPEDYWPLDPAPPSEKAWTDSIASYTGTLYNVKAMVKEIDDLTALVPTGKDGQTYLRAVLLVVDHAAYHVGQLVAARRALGIWP